MTSQLISVVVIGRNEGMRLARCFASVAAMTRDHFELELIYVDSGSTDQSLALASAAGAKVIALASLRPTAAQGRNAGWRAAGGELVLFLDGDTVLAPRFVQDSLPLFASPHVAIVWGHRRETFETRSMYNRVLDLDWIYPAGDAPFCGGDALMRRSILITTGGFDDTLIAGEEPELCRRILAHGMRIVHTDQPMTGHDLAITRFSQYWRRATRAGHAFAEVSSRFRYTAQPFWLAESKANVIRAAVLLALPLAGLMFTLTFQSMLPLVLILALLAALALRTAWKARWKSHDRLALLLYGIHSHLQQVPILVGQCRFWANQRRGRSAALVEYKRP